MCGVDSAYAREGSAPATELILAASCPFVPPFTGLSETQRRALVLADNRIAMNAGWDEELLGLELSDLQEAGFDLGLTGFGDDELQNLLYGIAINRTA